MAPKHSVFIPIYNEEDNILPLHKEIREVMENLPGTYEIIYVDDGSTDSSREKILSLEDARLIALNRNYGESIAVDAGLKAAKGELIISLDGDGQNDPKDIPRLLNKLEKEGLDVVTGERIRRTDGLMKRASSWLGFQFRRIILDDHIKDGGCTLRVYRRRAAKSLDVHCDMHRFIHVMLSWKGFKVGQIKVRDRGRKHGASKYTMKKLVPGLIDMFYVWFMIKHSERPIHLFGRLSILSLAMTALTGGIAIYQRFQGTHLNHNGWFFLSIFFGLVTVMLFSFGIVLNTMLRIYFNTSSYEERYYAREIKRSRDTEV